MRQDHNFWTDFARRREDQWCKALSQLLRYDTVSGDTDPIALQRWRGRIAEGFTYLNDLARGMGFVTRSYDNRVLVAEVPGPARAPTLGFPIHLDVVPAGEGWSRPPFGGEIADGAIWGRGAQDDKGPIIQVLFALLGAVEYARQSDRTFRKTVRLILVSEEECGVWEDIPFYFEREKPPDFTIVPDAHFPITNGEKGFVNLTVTMKWKSPLDGRFAIVSGERSNVVPAKAKLTASPNLIAGFPVAQHAGSQAQNAPAPPTILQTDDGIEVEFYGVGAHGSTPQLGHSAATDALKMAAALPSLASSPAAKSLAWLAQVSSSLDGAFLGIAHHHEKVGATTVNLGVLRVDAASIHAILNIRNPLGLSCAEVERRVRIALEKFAASNPGLIEASVELERTQREPIYTDPDQFVEWINPMKEAYLQTTGREAKLQSIGGTTFAKAFPNAVCFGPVDPDDEPELAHQADERVTLAAMRRNVEIYGRTILGVAL